jgi:hypothetical protein
MAQEADEKNGISEKHVEDSSHNDYDRHVAIHTDTFDIDEDALGNNLPRNYYMSPGFIGTVIVSNCHSEMKGGYLINLPGVVSRKHLQLSRLDHALQLPPSHQ